MPRSKSPTKRKPKSPTKRKPKSPTKRKPKSPTKRKPKSPTKRKPKSPTKRKPKSPTKRKPKKTAVGYKISKLRKEGMPQKQAVAVALSMEQSGRLGPRGGYKRVKKKKSKKQ